MKRYKKVLTGLSLALLFTAFLSFKFHVTAACIPNEPCGSPGSAVHYWTKQEFDNATYKFNPTPQKGSNEIDGTIGGVQVSFISVPLVNDKKFLPTDTLFCDNTILSNNNLKDSLNLHGIILNANFNDLSSGQLDAEINVDYKDSNGSCQTYTNSLTFIKQADGSITASQQASLTASNNDGGDDTSKCIASSHTTLEWILCPMTTALSKFTDLIIGSVEDQLNFNVSQMLPNSGGHTEVKRAWTIIKDLVSAALVIIMLVMVISQAFGGGPFEAYTIRKMLPRLVVAIILMQISWYLCRYIIGLSNDLGLGVKQLLTAAFGTAGSLDLPSLLHHLDPKAAFITEFSFWGLMLAGILIGASVMLPIILMLVLAVTLAVLVGLASIAFRNLLIIALVIFSPLALLLWILPGQSMQGYWKKYIDNFTKLLLLFPLMMTMIYSGRIMAWIAGGLGTWGPVDLLIVLVGFFGPLLLLPKAFKWGGEAMKIASNGIVSTSNKLGDRPKKFLVSRRDTALGERRRQSQERYASGEGFNIRRPFRRPIDLLRSGQLDPTLRGRPKEQAMTAYAAAGAESEEKDVKMADARANLLFAQVADHDALARAMASGDAEYRYITHADAAFNSEHELDEGDEGFRSHQLGHMSEAEIQAGLNAVAKYGGGTNYRYLDDRIDMLRNGSAQERAMAKQFLDHNVGSLQGKMKHLYYGENRGEAIDSMVDAMSENSFVGMEGAEMEAVLESLTQRVAAGGPEGANAQRRLDRVLTFYDAAISNDTIRPNIASGVNQAVEALVDGTNLTAINGRDAAGRDILNPRGGRTGRLRFRRDDGTEDHQIVRDGVVSTAGRPGPVDASTISGRISTVGRVVEPEPAPPPPPSTVVAEGALDVADRSGMTPRQEAYAENATRDEFNIYRNRINRTAVDPAGYPPLTPDEQRRFEQLRIDHPDW